MNKALKTTLKIALGSTAAVFAVGEIMYEGALNVKLTDKIVNTFDLSDKRMDDIFNFNPTFAAGNEWFEKMTPTDFSIPDEKGKMIHAYIIENPSKSNKWAVCVHGFRGSPKAQAPFAKHFYEKGYNIILPSLLAHDRDTNSYTTMGFKEKDMVIAWINYIVKKNPKSEILIHGVSMGSATTMLVTGESLPENVKCAVADCGYTSCWDEYVHEMKVLFHLPAFPLLNAANIISKARGGFDFKKCSPISAVSRSVTPTLFIHGTGDDFVPYPMMEELFDVCTAEKERLDVPDALHACSIAYSPDLYIKTMDKFTAKYL